ncbi:hypothetical protein M2093_001886 [Breznakia sp. PH1-1]|nr:hypothetical protein [Breznakia sp. PH1-1]MDH6404818.1 hypothetical protein [Breznakia sp. PF1-11]MDH6412556.1 hypothetical protein [Breznakia sp. PFB1-11]MDH6414893.1 hypothetical protein [Breznakia sp. PFB1-14]MDH6417227.1 hypothetical protein [Breznakia sp. PFB1-4]MDH6419566.1 hypothetical protein [Breznakia sp. PFB1-12]MDH6474621.1 hypothetical protein [Breznakia sp. PFB2-30]MDH6476966.1 hypothetical protein [Breznakia sp. PFB1-19]
MLFELFRDWLVGEKSEDRISERAYELILR